MKIRLNGECLPGGRRIWVDTTHLPRVGDFLVLPLEMEKNDLALKVERVVQYTVAFAHQECQCPEVWVKEQGNE